MTVLRHATHNQADKAGSPDRGWDVQCLTERSSAPAPPWAERHVAKRIKGLAIDWNPDLLEHRGGGSAVAHLGLAGFSPNRGTLWDEFNLIGTPWKVAVVCSHRLNDPDGDTRSFGPLRRTLWKVHAAQDKRIIRRLERRGFLVFYGGDINDRTADLRPLERLAGTLGHYDALGRPRDKRVHMTALDKTPGAPSDHARFTATYRIGEP